MYIKKGQTGIDGDFICTAYPNTIFNNTNYASKYLFGTIGYENDIAKALRTGKAFKGYKFEYVDMDLSEVDSYMFD